MVYNLFVTDKELLALFERQGFCRFLKREFPGYTVLERHTGQIVSSPRLVKLLRHHNQSNVHKSGMGLMLSLYMEAKEDQEKGKGI